MNAVHPGEQLALDLEDTGISLITMANVLYTNLEGLNNLLSGRSLFTDDQLAALATFYGTTVAYWENLQNNYLEELYGNAR